MFHRFLSMETTLMYLKKKKKKKKKERWLVDGLRPIDRLWDLGLQVESPPSGIFLRDPSPYSREFGGKPWKTLNG